MCGVENKLQIDYTRNTDSWPASVSFNIAIPEYQHKSEPPTSFIKLHWEGKKSRGERKARWERNNTEMGQGPGAIG